MRGGLSGEGVGVGLAVVRELVSLHGGTIVLNSQPAEGAEFIVRLPITGVVAGHSPGARGQQDGVNG